MGVIGLPHPPPHMPQATRLCSKARTSSNTCLSSRAPQNLLPLGLPLLPWQTCSRFLGLPGVKPYFPQAKAGDSLPKGNLCLPRASSPQHPGTARPLHRLSPAGAGSAPTRRAGDAVAFPGGVAQVKEEGAANNSGLCKTAAAPNFYLPFQTRVSQRPMAWAPRSPTHPLNPCRPRACGAHQGPSRAPGLPAFLPRDCSPSWGHGTVWAPNSLVPGRCGGCSVNS